MMRHRLTALALVLPLLAAPVTTGVLVLCVGSDGHVAVESAGASRCCLEWEAVHQAAPDDLEAILESAAGDCCDDLNLFVESATLTVSAQKLIPAGAVACRVAVPAAPLPMASSGAFPLSTKNAAAASLRTVVLRA